ncbi:copper chaperone PCu(A)C [Nocardiopsis quinghaiensis]|uniref:copper chaperone PCu(A)C n=1 Tax=Nocardiopsis quinghaiensis TaxID=464995 RepID=UPI00123C3D0A|nr:copper chaperone PCu(A)C [Nocardiopsis quinghaiensis]
MDRVRTIRTAHTAWAASLLCLGLALTACGGAPEEGTAPADQEAGAAATEADSFSVTDPWIKAVTAEEGMTGVFGELVNGSGQEITLVSASYGAAGKVELHESVTEGADSTMREKEGGFTVPPEGSHVLEPGADHIMVMDLAEDLEPGADANVTVEFSDGSTAEFTAAVKDYAGADEEYGGEGPEESQDGGHEGHEDH